MKTAVTGGTGFIGSALVRRLVAAGDEVRVLVRPGGAGHGALPRGVETVTGDVRDLDAVRRTVAGCERVFHLAAIAHFWAARKGVFEETNLGGTLNVLHAVRESRTIQRLIYTSSATVIQPAATLPPGGWRFLDRIEDAPGPYCRSKWLAGRAVMKAAGEGMPIVIVVPTTPLGPGDCNLTPPSRMLMDFLNGRIKALVDARLNVVDVRDCAAVHTAAAERGELGRIYMAGGHNVVLSDLFGVVARLAGVPAPAGRVPYGVALAFGFLAELIADRITHRRPLATTAGVRLARRTLWFDSSETAGAFGIGVRPLEETLRAAILDLSARGLLNRPVAPAAEPDLPPAPEPPVAPKETEAEDARS